MKHLKIKIDKLELGGELILSDIELTLNKDDRISIVGPNGSGKTTFMKALTGVISDFVGQIENIGDLTLGYLYQVYTDDETRTVHAELKDAFIELLDMEIQLKVLEEKMKTNIISSEGNESRDLGKQQKISPQGRNDKGEGQENLDNIIHSYTELLENFNHRGGYEYENKIHAVANGLGVLDLLDKKLTEISGGQRTKIALAKVLLEKPDILVLDEPTNFIDIESVEWLESYLQNKWYSGYVIVSHDREFLDKTCTKTLEIQPQRAPKLYHSNYSDYLIEREKNEKKQLENWERQGGYIDKQEDLINRFRAGSRAGWAKSRAKMIEKMEKLEKPYIPQKPQFYFNYIGDSSDKILDLKEAFIGRKEALFFIQEATVYKGQRIGIVGENGAGKSTFLKTVLGQIPLLEGTMSLGKSNEIIYYSQMHEELDKEKTVRDNFKKHGFFFPDQHMISILRHYLFEAADIDRKVSTLSGGQTSKLLFAILGQKSSNTLIFDEPTNHLDYDTRESLEASLSKYDGTIIFISHDRYFVNKLATHVWFVTEGELSISYGNYEDYRFKVEHNLGMDMVLFDEEAQLNLVLEEKLGKKEFRKMQQKFGKKRKRNR